MCYFDEVFDGRARVTKICKCDFVVYSPSKTQTCRHLLPQEEVIYNFSIFYYFRFLLLTSVKESTPLPLIIFMTGTDTTQPFIYHRSHQIHPWLKKTGTCLLKAPNILLYYFVQSSLNFLPLYCYNLRKGTQLIMREGTLMIT